MNEAKVRKAPDRWNLRYRGMTLEAIQVKPVNAEYRPWWCGYVYLPIDRAMMVAQAESLWLAPEGSKGINGHVVRSFYRYSGVPLISEAPAHGGVTYYHKHLGDGGKPPLPLELRYVCIGWDYNHLWDEDQSYTLEDVMKHAKLVADYFIEVLGLPGKEDHE